MSEVARPVAAQRTPLRCWLGAARPAHWSKNALLLVPVVAGQVEPSLELFGHMAVGFILMSMAASAGYMFNDLIDRPSDRQHPSKFRRPLAAGRIRGRDAGVLAFALAALSLGLAQFILGSGVAILLASYLLLTMLYSSALKRIPVLDVAVLATLYVLRLFVGGEIAGVVLSFWLICFGFTLFLTLAVAKRMDELAVQPAGVRRMLPGRPYCREHFVTVLRTCVASAVVTISILALYVAVSQNAEDIYRAHVWLWGATVLLGLWLAHILRQAAKGQLLGDPVLFAVSDAASLGLATMLAGTLFLAR